MNLAVNQSNCEHTAPCALDRAAHAAAWPAFRAAEAEGLYNVAPTVSLLTGVAESASAASAKYPDMQIFVSGSEGRDLRAFAVNFRGKYQSE